MIGPTKVIVVRSEMVGASAFVMSADHEASAHAITTMLLGKFLPHSCHIESLSLDIHMGKCSSSDTMLNFESLNLDAVICMSVDDLPYGALAPIRLVWVTEKAPHIFCLSLDLFDSSGRAGDAKTAIFPSPF